MSLIVLRIYLVRSTTLFVFHVTITSVLVNGGWWWGRQRFQNEFTILCRLHAWCLYSYQVHNIMRFSTECNLFVIHTNYTLWLNDWDMAAAPSPLNNCCNYDNWITMQGWSYVGDRLLSAVIPYEESGWYDGQMWVKPPEVSLFYTFLLYLRTEQKYPRRHHLWKSYQRL